jgi:hypothetical protein
MKSSSLAERLEEFEATIESLRLNEPPAHVMVRESQNSGSANTAPLRRAARRPRILIRDDGLRPFRVR